MRAILTYHSIDRSGSVISVTPEDFAAHIAWAASGAVQVVSVEALLAMPEDADAVAFTFDDALASVGSEAAPRLANHGLTATIFVVSQHVGGDNRWGGRSSGLVPVQSVLDWDALGGLVSTGWTLGSHTERHPSLPRCSDAELEDELAGAAGTLLHHTGATPQTFAYPYGDADDRVRTAVGRHYRVACSTTHAPLSATTDLLDVPRLDAWYFRGNAPFRDWGTPRFRRALAWRQALRRIRRVWG